MKILLDDIPFNELLYPFGTVRSMVHCRIGILTIFEKWDFYFPGNVIVASESSQYNEDVNEFLKVDANVIPSSNDLSKVVTKNKIEKLSDSRTIQYPWHFFQYNDWAIRQDFEMITNGRKSAEMPGGNQFSGLENIFIEEGVQIRFSILNAENGPIYIGKNAEVMEGSLLRGPLSIGENAVIKMGTKIYGATTIGTNCVAGGEIKNSIMMAFSNKSHDGYLGDSVLGEWCNLGAGTSNSNLKNNVSSIKVWSKSGNKFENAGNKCGLLMGDYSRSAINSSFNTGTTVGVCCNIFGDHFPEKFIDNFTWGNEKYLFEKAITDISNWKKLKGQEITPEEIKSLNKIYYSKKTS